jgi:heterodisulfide reductase subunit A
MRLARLVKYQKPEAKVTIFYIDLQTAGKGFPEFYERWRDSIRFVRGVPVEVSDESDNKLKVRFEDFSQAKPVEEDFDMVILSVGITPKGDAWELARVLGINVDEFGFYDSEDGVTTNVDNVFLAGTCQGPKDIPDSIAHGMAAAKKVIESLSVKKQSS